MNRRQLLTTGAAGVLVGTNGCLGAGFGSTAADPNGDGVDDCERFGGEFGALSISVPAEIPTETSVLELEDTPLASLEDVSRELESAREQHGDAEEAIDEYGMQFQRVGWITLGNGDLYDSVDDSLSEFKRTDTMSPYDVWYAEYDGNIFRLVLRRRDYPFGRPNTNASTHTTDDPLEVTAGSSPPDSATVIDAEEALIPESEFFVTVLEVAQCHQEGTDFDFRGASTMEYYIPPTETDLLTGFEKADAGWYVEYGDEFYVFDIHFSSY